MTKSSANRQGKCMYKNHLTILQTQFQLPQEFFLSQRLIIDDEVFVGRFDKQPLNNLCLLNGDALLPSSIVSDDKSSHTSIRRISSIIPLLIFSQRLLHFVVFGISNLESYNQRFFKSEIDIFLNVRLNPPYLPGYNVARLPGCSLNIQ